MKKVVSIIMCAAMLVSLFSVSVSAIVPETYMAGATPEENVLNVDFESEATTDFTNGLYGTRTVENGVMVHTKPSSNENHMYSAADISGLADRYAVEFDVKVNFDMTAGNKYTFAFAVRKPSRSTDANLKEYGMSVPLQDMAKETWYRYRVIVDEASYIAARDKGSAHPRNLITYVGRKVLNDDDFVALSYDASLGNAVADGKYMVRTDGVNWFNYDPYVSGVDTTIHLGFKSAGDATTNRNTVSYSLDNVRFYVPANEGVETAYPVNEGVFMTDKAEYVINGATDDMTNAAFPFKRWNWTQDEAIDSYMISFDAINSKAGMPLAVYGGTSINLAEALAFRSFTGDFNNTWYSYRIYINNKTENGVVAITSVWRKPVDGGTWTQLTIDSYNSKTGSNECFYTNRQGGMKNQLFVSMEPVLKTFLPEGITTCANSEWKVKNIQITNAVAVTGVLEKGYGKVTGNFNVGTVPSGNVVIAAVHTAGGQLVDVEAKTVNGEDTWNPDLTYSEGDIITLYAWDSLTGFVPLKAETVLSAE